MDYIFSFFLRRLFTSKMCEQAPGAEAGKHDFFSWTFSPKCPQKLPTEIDSLPFELFSAQLQKDMLRLATPQPGL